MATESSRWEINLQKYKFINLARVFEEVFPQVILSILIDSIAESVQFQTKKWHNF